MARRTIFSATFCCGNMLQQFEVDSNCCNIVARTLSELVHVTTSPSTFNATLYQNAPRESRNKSRDQSTSAFFMSTDKMAEIVDSEAAPVDTFVLEARLDDNDRHKLIAFYKEKQILWDTSLKLSKKAAKEQKETALKDLEEHFDFNYTSDELVGVWKSLYMDANTPNQIIKLLFVHAKISRERRSSSTANSLISWWYAPLSSLLLIQLLVQITLSRLLKTSSSSKLSNKRRICRNFTFLRWFDSSSTILLAEMLTLLLIAHAMLR